MKTIRTAALAAASILALAACGGDHPGTLGGDLGMSIKAAEAAANAPRDSVTLDGQRLDRLLNAAAAYEAILQKQVEEQAAAIQAGANVQSFWGDDNISGGRVTLAVGRLCAKIPDGSHPVQAIIRPGSQWERGEDTPTNHPVPELLFGKTPLYRLANGNWSDRPEAKGTQFAFVIDTRLGRYDDERREKGAIKCIDTVVR